MAAGSPAYEPAKQNFYAFDLDKAKSLLAEAGVTISSSTSGRIRSTTRPPALAQIYQADLAKIGVKMNIKNYDGATWLDQVNGRKFNGIYLAVRHVLQPLAEHGAYQRQGVQSRPQ